MLYDFECIAPDEVEGEGIILEAETYHAAISRAFDRPYDVKKAHGAGYNVHTTYGEYRVIRRDAVKA